jgi:hypothetical protein
VETKRKTKQAASRTWADMKFWSLEPFYILE